MKRYGRRQLFLLVTVLVLISLGFCYGPAEEDGGSPQPEAGHGEAAGEIIKANLSVDLMPPGERESPPAAERPAPDAAVDRKHRVEGYSGAGTVEPNTSKGSEPRQVKNGIPDLDEAGQAGPVPAPGKAPAVQPPTAPPAQQPAPPPAPVTYAWLGSHQITFRSEVQVTNIGSERAACVWVDLPMPENSSPYQDTRLQSTNHELAYMSGRIGSFGVGDLEPGETVTIQTDYAITIRPVMINSTNETMEKARQVYLQYAGSGNCFQLASGFVNGCRGMGISARLVNGFAGSRGCSIGAGSLEGRRHSWAEFHVDGLGWVPVDLTYKYFAELPCASHMVETYADETVKAYHMGGKISMKWSNMIL